jgi:internalin A
VTSLHQLAIDSCGVTDLSPLASVLELSMLYARDNAFVDLSPLTGLTSLSTLDLANNQITDLTPLVQNTGLETGYLVDVTGNPIDCMSQAANLQALDSRVTTLINDCF